MKQSVGWRRIVLLSVGASLLVVSVLFWAIIIALAIDDPQYAGWIILAGVLLSTFPIAIGIYCLRRGTKSPTVEKAWKVVFYTLAIIPVAIMNLLGSGRSNRFRAGVILLFISALLWLLLLLVMSAEPEGTGAIILGGLVTTALPVGLGIYLVRRGGKALTVEMGQSPKPTYASQPAVTPTRETQWTPEPTAKLTQEMQRAPEPAYASQPSVKPVQTYRGLFGWLKEKLRDKTRDELCAALCAIGLDARMAERGRPEEHIGEDWKGKSKGLVEIRGSPIQWVNVFQETGGGGP